MTASHRLVADSVTLSYGSRTVAQGLDLEVLPGRITSIVGANGCGKSTLLRVFARLLKPQAGSVLLDGQAIHNVPSKQLARTLGLLPQNPIAPEGIVVADLVGRGRHPHQGAFARWSAHDYEVVADALAATGISDLAERAAGPPSDILTPDLVREVYGLDSSIIPDPVSRTPLVLPKGRHHVSVSA